MKNTRLKDIMTPDPVTLNIDEPFCKVAQIFKSRDIRHLPVVNAGGVIMGVISQRDFNRITSPERTPEGEYVYDMNAIAKYVLKQHVVQHVVTLSPDDTLERAVELMAEKKLGCIPITDAELKVVGIVTAIDALKLLLKILRTASSCCPGRGCGEGV
jgi:CBS domain-containing protein